MLLSIIDAEQANEDIDEDQVSRQTRLTVRAMAGRLVATIIAEQRLAAAVSMRKQYRLGIVCPTGSM